MTAAGTTRYRVVVAVYDSRGETVSVVTISDALSLDPRV
jgi:hypothetical protein